MFSGDNLGLETLSGPLHLSFMTGWSDVLWFLCRTQRIVMCLSRFEVFMLFVAKDSFQDGLRSFETPETFTGRQGLTSKK